ncbi:MAG: hypothetical protein HZB24_00460, partial [Desulfobacterales bacterium]|nr:hypothetical protein [Desulfobacterales bacterium]
MGDSNQARAESVIERIDGEMELISSFFDIIMHLDDQMTYIVSKYGTWTYVILFLIVFCETGLVVTPILPGDSLLFAAGSICARGALNP